MNATIQIVEEAKRTKSTEFPGMDAIGTDNKMVADAVVYALRVVQWAQAPEVMEVVGSWENTEAFGRLDAMIEYGVVDPAEVIAAIQRWRLA